MIERRSCVTGRVEESFDRPVLTLEAGLTWKAHEPGTVLVTMQVFETATAEDGEQVLRGLLASVPRSSGIIYERRAWVQSDRGVFGRFGIVLWSET